MIRVTQRLIVATQWLWSYVSFERGARLIIGTRALPKNDPTDRPADQAPPTD